MNRPEDFILNTDYATLKNDGSGTMSLVVPSAMVLTANQLWTITTGLQIGQINASIRGRIASSKEGNDFYVSSVYVVNRIGSTASMPGASPYIINAYLARSDAGTLQATLAIQNPYGENLTTASVAETFTFYANTFLSPFQ